jgi:hypothetical protein
VQQADAYHSSFTCSKTLAGALHALLFAANWLLQQHDLNHHKQRAAARMPAPSCYLGISQHVAGDTSL